LENVQAAFGRRGDVRRGRRRIPVDCEIYVVPGRLFPGAKAASLSFSAALPKSFSVIRSRGARGKLRGVVGKLPTTTGKLPVLPRMGAFAAGVNDPDYS
jgi:hypothetical protein